MDQKNLLFLHFVFNGPFVCIKLNTLGPQLRIIKFYQKKKLRIIKESKGDRSKVDM